MSKDLEIVSEYNDCYEDAYRVWGSFYPLADRDLRFYLGDQWDAQERKKLLEEGRNAFVFNRTRRNINMVIGYQRKNRLSSIVTPVENSDQLTADQLSQLLLFVMQGSDGYRMISRCWNSKCLLIRSSVRQYESVFKLWELGKWLGIRYDYFAACLKKLKKLLLFQDEPMRFFQDFKISINRYYRTPSAIERFFGRIKENKRLALRFDKLAAIKISWINLLNSTIPNLKRVNSSPQYES